MDKPLTMDNLKELEGNLRSAVEEDRKYWLINDVKCDAVNTAKTYEEFSDRVAVAHLKPLEKSDKLQSEKTKTVWNSCARKKIKREEDE